MAPRGPGWIVSPAMRKLAGSVAAVVALAAIAACQGGTSDPNAADRQFATTLAPIEYQGATIAALVADRAKNPGVKTFAADYHAEAEHAIQVIDGRGAALRTRIRNDAITEGLLDVSTIRKLQDESGEPFDRDVMTALIDRANLAARLCAAEVRDGGDPFLTGLARQLGKQRTTEAQRMAGLLSLLPQ